MKKPTIGAFYQCYKQSKAFLHSVRSFRRVYKNSNFYAISDGGFNYSDISKKLKFNFVYDKQIGNGKTTLLDSRESFKKWLGRLFFVAKNIQEDYLIILEDDVKVLSKVKKLKFDLNGVNKSERMGENMTKFLKNHGAKIPKDCSNYFYGGCGGAILKKDFVLKNLNPENIDIAMDELSKYLDSRHLGHFHSDYWLSILTLYYGGTIGQYSGFCERVRERRIFWFKFLLGKISVLHQYKKYYNKELNIKEKDFLGNISSDIL